ncbi:hypothetical protein ACM9ZQ_19040 [Escherichia coli]|uniref:hypothetical protein n=1 Tax=Escherichia coli TaxID=562 RepID=UPI0003EF9B5F|nr:hypothetical protein [Escherichia coli]EGB2672715.1 hypothetical protein [Escherichia coli]EJA1216559.1 hypothetical protein [Escherichia coli]MCZ0571158.1 hypothetical protein [Escherichia coli]HAI7179493.1 hypothetical protein [Escherichia coli]HAW3000201.1 hypothetical protein [Escherichia coli]
MDNEVTFSLSYEQLTREAEDAIKKCNLNQDGMSYPLELGKASAILNFWYGLALCGQPDARESERVEADWQRLCDLVHQRKDGGA